MSIYVKDSGTWSLAGNVYVKNGGTIIEPQEVYIKDGGVWKLLHKVIYISSSTNNLDLYSYIGSPSTALRLLVHVDSGVTISSNSSSTPALTVSSFPANSQIKIVNRGSIVGAGGGGGTGANYGGSATSGAQGGTALLVTGNLTLENQGSIVGGGGGGGGGGYSSTTSTCFPAGTLINTPNGLVAIETLNPGDIVYGFDIDADNYSAELVAKPVTQVFKHSWSEADEYSKLVVIEHENGILTITGNHEVLTSSRSATGPYEHFVRAEHLQIGDIIYDSLGMPSEILEITPGEPYDYVYNFEVADVHTYVASGIRVHNGGGGGGGKGTTTTTYAGGGGGGGAGTNVGTGGSGGSGANNNGSSGSNGTSGAGGGGGNYNSGNGGGPGVAGSAGSGSNPGNGGGAGYYIYGNTFVTYTVTGTLTGSVA